MAGFEGKVEKLFDTGECLCFRVMGWAYIVVGLQLGTFSMNCLCAVQFFAAAKNKCCYMRAALGRRTWGCCWMRSWT